MNVRTLTEESEEGRQRRLLVESLSMQEPVRAIETLTRGGLCTRDELIEYLWPLRRSRKWKRLSKEVLVDGVDALSRASQFLREAELSEYARIAFDQEPEERLAKVIRVLDGIRSRIQFDANTVTSGGERTPRTDRAENRLQRFVQERTGRAHSREVGILIEAATGGRLKAGGYAMRRSRRSRSKDETRKRFARG